jgi:hypothetical protein
MSLATRNNDETSVTFSLAELARIEEERVREEDGKRAEARAQHAREQREAEKRRRAAEEAQLAAEAEARSRRVRAEAEEKVRAEARERAAAEVARIEAQGRARLDDANAQRAHELALLRTRTEGGRRALQIALGTVLALTLGGGSAAAYGVSRHVEGLAADTAQLREGQQALAREREQAKTTELAALDRRFTALRQRPLLREAEDARATAAAARQAIDPKTLDHDRLRAFGDALEALDARLDTLDRIADLDRRQADLATWAADRKRGEAAAAAKLAGTRARLMATDDALRAYEGELDKLRDALAQAPAAGPGGRTAVKVADGNPGTCLKGDPRCDIYGRPLF